MPVELRKRKAHQLPVDPPAKKAPKAAKAAEKPKTKKKTALRGDYTNGTGRVSRPSKSEPVVEKKTELKPAVGDEITLDGFGGEIETNDAEKTTLKALVDESKAGVVLFTYPKASTPGCTNQVCLFRDSYEDLTAGGLAIYGLSADSPRANTTFKEKQRLPYPLLCDPAFGLIGAIGLAKVPRGTVRGVFAVDKAGKVLVAQPGSPAATVEAVRKLVDGLSDGKDDAAEGDVKDEKKDEPAADANGDASKEAQENGEKDEKEEKE